MNIIRTATHSQTRQYAPRAPAQNTELVLSSGHPIYAQLFDDGVERGVQYFCGSRDLGCVIDSRTLAPAPARSGNRLAKMAGTLGGMLLAAGCATNTPAASAVASLTDSNGVFPGTALVSASSSVRRNQGSVGTNAAVNFTHGTSLDMIPVIASANEQTTWDSTGTRSTVYQEEGLRLRSGILVPGYFALLPEFGIARNNELSRRTPILSETIITPGASGVLGFEVLKTTPLAGYLQLGIGARKILDSGLDETSIRDSTGTHAKLTTDGWQAGAQLLYDLRLAPTQGMLFGLGGQIEELDRLLTGKTRLGTMTLTDALNQQIVSGEASVYSTRFFANNFSSLGLISGYSDAQRTARQTGGKTSSDRLESVWAGLRARQQVGPMYFTLDGVVVNESKDGPVGGAFTFGGVVLF